MQLNKIIPWGRTFAEYRDMFALSDADLNQKILGCGDGPASFNAQMTELGYSVVSIDPVYQFSAEQICQPSPYLEPVIQEFSSQGLDVQVRQVEYEFQKGGDRMLTIGR
jgi:hypothetical protein